MIQPMSLGSALLHFFIPAILAALNTYFVMAFFAGIGLPTFLNYIVIYATKKVLAEQLDWTIKSVGKIIVRRI